MKIQINQQEISRNISDDNKYQPSEQTPPSGEQDRFEKLLNKAGNENETNEKQEESSGATQKSGTQEEVSQQEPQGDATTTPEEDKDQSAQEDSLEQRQHPSDADKAAKKAEKKQGRLDGDPRLSPGLLSEGAPTLAKLPGGNLATETQSVASPAQLHELTEKIVSRILVSAPGDAAKTPEVRITLDNGIMKGTEVRITRNGNELNVAFFTETADAGNLLSQQQGTMKQTLAQNLKLDVSVSVADAHSQQQQDNQGRSRQRRFIQDEYESD